MCRTRAYCNPGKIYKNRNMPRYTLAKVLDHKGNKVIYKGKIEYFLGPTYSKKYVSYFLEFTHRNLKTSEQNL